MDADGIVIFIEIDGAKRLPNFRHFRHLTILGILRPLLKKARRISRPQAFSIYSNSDLRSLLIRIVTEPAAVQAPVCLAERLFFGKDQIGLGKGTDPLLYRQLGHLGPFAR